MRTQQPARSTISKILQMSQRTLSPGRTILLYRQRIKRQSRKSMRTIRLISCSTRRKQLDIPSPKASQLTRLLGCIRLQCSTMQTLSMLRAVLTMVSLSNSTNKSSFLQVGTLLTQSLMTTVTYSSLQPAKAQNASSISPCMAAEDKRKA